MAVKLFSTVAWPWIACAPASSPAAWRLAWSLIAASRAWTFSFSFTALACASPLFSPRATR
jgi:hypothetical protein